MIFRERSRRRPLLGHLFIATSVAALVAVAAGPAGAAPSSSNGGFLVRPGAFHFATVQFRVPRLSCAASATTRVRVGLSGDTTNDGGSIPWFAAVVARCVRGKQRAYEVFGDYTPVQKKAVHPGDRVKITTRGNSPTSTIVDLTSGTRLVGGPLPPPGQVTDARVTIGGQRSGSAAGHLHLSLLDGAVNGKPFTAFRRQRLTQAVSGHPVTRAGELNEAGTGFSLYFS